MWRSDPLFERDGQILASVERKSLADLVATMTGGRLWYLLADLASLDRAAYRHAHPAGVPQGPSG